MDPVYVYVMQVGVICKKKINSSSCGASKLDRIGRAYVYFILRAQLCEIACGKDVKIDHKCRCADGFFIFLTGQVVSNRVWFCQYFSDCQGRSHELISPFKHPAP